MWLTRHKTLVIAIGVGFAAFLLVFVAIMPMYQNTTTLLAKIKTTTLQRDDLASKVSIASQLDPVVTTSRVATLDAALPPRKDVLLYLSAIDGLSRELGLTFGGITLSPGDLATGSAQKGAIPATGLQTLETSIKMGGSQESIYTFLRTIEQVLPLMQIKDIKVSVLANNQYALTVTLGMLWADPSTGTAKGNVSLFTDAETKNFTDLAQYRQFTAVGGPSSLESPVASRQDVFQSIANPAVTVKTASPSAKPQL